MLYDPKWEIKTKADPFSLEGFIGWLEKQPRDGAYHWYNIGDCVACKYLQAQGFSEPWTIPYPSVFGGIETYQAVGRPMPWTFGAALSRARKALAER